MHGNISLAFNLHGQRAKIMKAEPTNNASQDCGQMEVNPYVVFLVCELCATRAIVRGLTLLAKRTSVNCGIYAYLCVSGRT